MTAHRWTDRSEHEKRCDGCHTTVVRLFRPGGDGYDVQYFAPDGAQVQAAPACGTPAPTSPGPPQPPAPFYVFAGLPAPLSETQAAALRRELTASPARGWHVNAAPAFVSVRLEAGSMPGAEAAARPVIAGAFARAGLGEPPWDQLIAIPLQPHDGAMTTRREPVEPAHGAPAPVTQPLLLEAG